MDRPPGGDTAPGDPAASVATGSATAAGDARLATVARRIRLGSGLRIGIHTWYLVGNGPSRGVIEVKRGVIVAIGIAERKLTARRSTARTLLRQIT